MNVRNIIKLLVLVFTLNLALPLYAVEPSPKKTLVIIGDSLTEGFGVRKEAAFPHLLEKKILASGKSWRVINSGVSGSTSASAESRVAWALKQKPNFILLALGANDGLRGTSVSAMETNLEKAIDAAKKAGVKVALAGMRMPPNYGDYARKFDAAFQKVAKSTNVLLISFLLEGVAGEKAKNLADGIHPNEKGHAEIAENVFNVIREHL